MVGRCTLCGSAKGIVNSDKVLYLRGGIDCPAKKLASERRCRRENEEEMHLSRIKQEELEEKLKKLRDYNRGKGPNPYFSAEELIKVRRYQA
jgi:hypothetical protein